MYELLEFITKNITGSESIEINETENDGVITYQIIAPKEVMGLLIGKEGKTVRAIRSLAKARAIIDNTKINLIIEEKTT